MSLLRHSRKCRRRSHHRDYRELRGSAAMDYGILPPEINSARMYAGPGSGPMLAAASAWDGLAAELGSRRLSYRGDLRVDRGLLAGAGFSVDGGGSHSICLVDECSCRASRADRQPSTGGSGSL